MNIQACPCGSGKSYAACCEPCHLNLNAGTAEQLMRSRYSAYVLKQPDYLLQTWHRSTRPPQLELQQGRQKWLGLKIINCERSREQDTHASVEFIARYKIAGKATRLHEISEFIKEQGRWYYLTGKPGAVR